MKPLGYDHRHRRGLLGVLCRWWYRRRVCQVLRARHLCEDGSEFRSDNR